MVSVASSVQGVAAGAQQAAAPTDSRRADTFAVLVLAGLVFLFFGPVLFLDHALYWGDPILGFYPAHDLWRQYVLSAHLPTWNPYIFNGLPFLADAEYSTLYPSLLLNLVLPLHRALAVDLALHLFLAGLFTYLFLRQQRLPVAPALLGGIVFACGGYLAVRIVHVSLIRTGAWFPLLLLILARSPFPRSGRYVLALGVVLALQLLGGHAQTVLISGLLLVLFGLWTVFVGGRGRSPWNRRLLGAMGIGTLVALCGLVLAAAQVLPALEMAQHSDRSGGKGLAFATSFSLPARQLPMLLLPNVLGNPHQEGYFGQWVYWEMIGYAGVVTFLLALLGLLASRRRERLLWGTVSLLGIILAMGTDTPLYRVAYAIVPTLDYFRVPARFLFWFAWGMAVLAAYGTERLLPPVQLDSPRVWRLLLIAAGLVAAAMLYVAARGPGVPAFLTWFTGQTALIGRDLPEVARAEITAAVTQAAVLETRRFALLWIGGGILIVAILTGRLQPRLGQFLLVALVAADLFGYGARHYPTVPPAVLQRSIPTPGLLDLEGGRYRILTTRNYVLFWFAHMTNQDRVRTLEELDAFRTALVPNTAGLWGIANVAGYTPIAVGNVLQFVDASGEDAVRHGGSSRLLDFQGARYIFTRANLADRYAPVYRGRTYFVWRNERALPRGYLVTQYEVQPDERVLPRLLEGWDPARVVVLAAAPAETYGLRPGVDPGRVTTRTYGLNRQVFDLELAAPAIFVLSDTYYPGWTAYIDGRRRPILRANLAFQAVALPAGARRLEFVFESRSAIAGSLVSAAGWLALAVAGAGFALDGRRRRAGSRSEGASGRA
jgi:hypothetical protein